MTPANIPAELRALRQWIVWRLEAVEGRGKPAKVPYVALSTGAGVRERRAKTNDPADWTSFEVAEEAVRLHGFAGVGFVFTGTDYVGIDLDGAIGDDGVPGPNSLDILRLFPGAYVEVSQSGRGLHIIVKGALPPGAKRRGPVEAYDRASPRYFALTGDVYGERCDAIPRLDSALLAFHARWLGDSSPETVAPQGVADAGQKASQKPKMTKDGRIEDAEVAHVLALAERRVLVLVAKAKAASVGFSSTFNFGETRPGKSGSESDSWMARELAKWERDPQVILAAMQASALARPKWNEHRPNSPTGTLIGLAIADALEAVPPAPEAAAPEAVVPIESELLGEMMDTPDPMTGWLVDELWHVTDRGWIAGEAKIGKSWLAMEMAVAVATGTPFLGRYRVAKAGRVLYLTTESSKAKVTERLVAIARGRPHPERWLRHARRRIRVVRQSVRFDDAASTARVLALVRAFKPSFTVIDPMRRYHIAEEKDSTAMQPVLEAIAAVQALGTAVAVVHHMRKTSEQNAAARGGQQLRGSSDFHAWSDVGLYVSSPRGSKIMAVEAELKDDEEAGNFTVERIHEPGAVRFKVESGDAADIQLREAAAKIEAVLRALPAGVRMTTTAVRQHEAVRVSTELAGQALAYLDRYGRANAESGGRGAKLWAAGAAVIDANLDANESART